MNRIFLGLVVAASLIWLGYVSMDILSESNNFTPEYLFCSQDDKVLIINRPEEVNVDVLSDFANAPMAGTYRNLDRAGFTTAFLSANQAQLLLVKSANWTVDEIKALFTDSSSSLRFDNDDFYFGKVKGHFYKKNLYLWEGDIQHAEGKQIQFSYDKKASASILHLSGEKGVQSITDVYFKGDKRIDYISYYDAILQGNQVQDELLFANVVTSNFSRYHFLERDYYAGQDSVFANGPMFRWMQSGYLQLEYGGATAIISDYIDGQDPILILNDLSQSLDKNSFEHRLTRDFPSANKKYFIKYLEDLVVISEDESVCDKIIGDFKLGHTISLNKGVRFQLFGSLPRSVSERIVTKEQAYSKSVYKGHLLETQMGEQIALSVNKPSTESTALNCGFDIADFIVLPRKGNVIAVGHKGEIARFKDGKLAWSKRLSESLIGGVQLIDLHQTGEQFILVTTRDEIHLWNMNGEAVNGFPIHLDNRASLAVKFYRWKEQSYFLQLTEDHEIVHYDARGRELNAMKIAISPTRPIDVWASQNTLFAGVASTTNFVMINLDRHEIFREFPLPGASFPLKTQNELFQYGVADNKLYKVTQKGVRMDFGTYANGKILGLQSEGKTNVLIVQSSNDLHLLNPEGIPFCKINLSFNEVEHVFVQTFDSGKTLTAVIDGLENNVYLYSLDGARIKHEPMEGQTKVFLSSEAEGTVVTTVVDQFVVQYFE